VAIILTWDDVFGVATTDYDLFALDDETGEAVTVGGNDNPRVAGVPVEVVTFTNTSEGFKFWDFLIQNFENSSPVKTFDMFVPRGLPLQCFEQTDFNYNTGRSSVPAQTDAGGEEVSADAIFTSDPGGERYRVLQQSRPNQQRRHQARRYRYRRRLHHRRRRVRLSLLRHFDRGATPGRPRGPAFRSHSAPAEWRALRRPRSRPRRPAHCHPWHRL